MNQYKESAMDRKKWLITFLVLLTGVISCGSHSGKMLSTLPLSFKVVVENPANIVRKDALIEIKLQEVAELYPDFNPQAWAVFDETSEIPSQINEDSKELVFVADFNPSQKRIFTIHYAKEGSVTHKYPKRTQAELSHMVGGRFVNRVYEGGEFKNVEYLRVPPEHTDHSLYIRYEGPGWESDKIGYRFYLDWRNAIDIYGKKIPDMVLQDVGQDGFESYHSLSSWGMDILKVGESLGIGSLGMWLENRAERVAITDSVICEIVRNGAIESQIRTRYYGWKIAGKKYDLVSGLSIAAGSRLTRHDIRMTGKPPNLCTGIVKMENVSLLSSTNQNCEWMYFATYGKQSLNNDKLGLAVLFRRSDLIQITDDKHSYVVVLKPTGGELTYYFLGAWELEQDGIKSESQFSDYLNETVAILDQGLKVTVK